MRHGTTSSYKRCSCDVCAEARREYMRQYREKNRDALRAKERAYHQANREARNEDRRRRHDPERQQGARLLAWYGITTATFAEILDSQGGVCAICGTDDPGGKCAWRVDHDHSCCPGKKSCGECVRGLLCNNCNVGIGMFREDTTALAAAIQYLRKL